MNAIGPIRTRIKLTEDIAKTFLSRLPAEHILHTLYLEHQVITMLITRLDELRNLIWEMNSPLDHSDIFVELLDVMEKLATSDSHHDREEHILFPELAIRGIQKFHQVLSSEHSFIKKYKEEFTTMVKGMGETDFHTYKLQLNFQANGIIGILREHIYRENTAVFPLSLEVIKEEECWIAMQAASKQLGYELLENVKI